MEAPTQHSLQHHYIFFYSAHPQAHNGLQYGAFAQTKRIDAHLHIPDEGEFVSAEQYYQYRKAVIIARHNCAKNVKDSKHATVNAEDLPTAILGANTVKDWKGLTHNFDLTVPPEAYREWQDSICEVLFKANFYKFKDGPLRKTLLDTGEKFLVEACPEDCTCDCGISHRWNDALAHRATWRANLLGKTLMLVRSLLRSDQLPEHPPAADIEAARNLMTINDGRDFECDENCLAGSRLLRPGFRTGFNRECKSCKTRKDIGYFFRPERRDESAYKNFLCDYCRDQVFDPATRTVRNMTSAELLNKSASGAKMEGSPATRS